MRLYESIYAFVQTPRLQFRSAAMSASQSPSLQDCNCLAIRQAARHVTQFYDQLFAPVGLRATQFAILNRLRRDGPRWWRDMARRD